MNPFTKNHRQSVGALGEVELIHRVRRWLGDAGLRSPFGIGDDCAVFPASKKPQIITVDPVIFGRHFDASVPAKSAGAKLLKRNLSDIAAMGGKPTIAVVSLTLDPQVSAAWLENFYRGLAQCAREYGVRVVGGDVASAENVVVASLTLLGQATADRLLTRIGARRADQIWVTGELGGSRVGHHLTFVPRLREGAWLAQQPDVRSMMDVSDGLAKDLGALTPARCRASIMKSQLPISAAARRGKTKSRVEPWVSALCDGEDYELVFTLRAGADVAAFSARWAKRFRTRLTYLGKFVSDRIAIADGEVDFRSLQGYEHF